MEVLRNFFRRDLIVNEDGIGTDRHGKRWVPLEHLENLQSIHDFELSIKSGHMEAVIQWLNESEEDDLLKEFLLKNLKHLGYDIIPWPPDPYFSGQIK